MNANKDGALQPEVGFLSALVVVWLRSVVRAWSFVSTESRCGAGPFESLLWRLGGQQALGVADHPLEFERGLGFAAFPVRPYGL